MTRQFLSSDLNPTGPDPTSPAPTWLAEALILTLSVRQARDLAAIRQHIQHLTMLLGIDTLCQMRFTAALSEAVLAILSEGFSSQVKLSIEPAIDSHHPSEPAVCRLAAEIRSDAKAGENLEAIDISVIRRLADYFDIGLEANGTWRIVLGCDLRLPPDIILERLEGAIDQRAPAAGDMQDLIRQQNWEIISTLDDLQSRQLELDRLNAELQDTNRGVVALYSELDEKAEQLKRASELKSKFLSNMGHEFRTPLNSILALSGLLMDRADGDLSTEQERQVTYIRSAASSLTELVNDLLDLAKVESGNVAIRKTTFSASELIGGLRGLLKPLLSSDEVALIFDEPVGLPQFYTDMGKVSQILRNFISNAIKFTEQGEVRLSSRLSSSGQRIEFSVSDTGIGIAPENHAAVFDEFVQIENPIQTRHQGTGLGLPLSKRLAELLGGDVALRSAIGEGSTFTLSIPPDIDNPAAIFEIQEVAPHHLPVIGNMLCLLVIDDEEAFRYVIRHSATEAHCTTIEASDGLSGLAVLREKQPDLVFLDLQMPVMDGYKVLEEVRRDPALAQIPIVICTSSSPDLLDKEKLAAADMILPKSALSRDAVARVLSQLNLSARQDEDSGK